MERNSSAVHEINNHFIRCPKYRKPILEEPRVKEFLEDQVHTIAETKEQEILALEVMSVYIHILISVTPFNAPTALVKVFKGVTALRLFKKFPELRGKYWKGKLWSPSYCVETAGMSQPRAFKGTSRSKRKVDAIHPPYK